MNKPSSKIELLAVMRTEREEWEMLLREFDEAQMHEPGVDGEWSIRDIIAHLMAWERIAGTFLNDELHHQSPTPFDLYGEDEVPVGFDWHDTDRYNDWNILQNRKHPLPDLLDEAHRAFQLLYSALHSCPEEYLDDPHRFAWTEGKTLSEYIIDESYGHYREHIPAVLAWKHRKHN